MNLYDGVCKMWNIVKLFQEKWCHNMPRSNPSTKHLGNLSSETTRDYVRLRARRRCWSGAFSCQPWSGPWSGKWRKWGKWGKSKYQGCTAWCTACTSLAAAPTLCLWATTFNISNIPIASTSLHLHRFTFILHPYVTSILHVVMTKLFFLGKGIDLKVFVVQK